MGKSESARGTMGRGKSGREAAAFSFFPSSIALSRVFFFLPSLLEYPAAASAKEGVIIPRSQYVSGRSPRMRHRNALTEKACENAVQ